MKRKFIKIGIGSLLAVVVFSITAFTESYVRSINAWFNNIKVKVDGKEILLDKEPFIFDDNLYLPSSVLERGLNLDCYYAQNGNIVNIQTSGQLDPDSETSLSSIIQQKNYERQSLSRQLEETEKELHRLKQSKFPYRRINTVGEMETYLKDHFKYLDEIPMAINLAKLPNNKYRIIAIPTTSSGLLSSLDRRDIEGWVENMFSAIRELYDTNANVEGYIRRSTYATNHVDYYTSGNRLYFNFARLQNKESSQIDGIRLEEKLNKGNLRRYNNVSFSYEVFVNRYDIDLVIHFDQKQFYNWEPSTKIRYLNSVKREIELFNAYINVKGKIVDNNKAKDNTVFVFGIVDGTVRSLDLLQDAKTYLNKNYSTFYHEGKIFKFSYHIEEGKDEQLIINIDGNFSKQDTNWTNVKDTVASDLKNYIQSAFIYVDGIFNKDISGELVDKDREFICGLRYYKPGKYSIRILEYITIQ